MYRGASPRGSGHAQHLHRHGQTVIPAPIRARFSLGPSQRLEWIVEALARHGPLRRSSQRLLADREAGRVEHVFAQPQRCHACFVSRMEVLDRAWKDEGEHAGRLADEQLKACHPLHKDPRFRAVADSPQKWLA